VTPGTAAPPGLGVPDDLAAERARHGEALADVPLERVNAPQPFVRGFLRSAREVVAYRELLANLVRKELKIKYKDSVLGFLWTLVRPLLQLIIYSVAIGLFLGSGKVIPEFGVYLYTGLLVWTLFTEIMGGCTSSVVGNAALIKKVYFPRELFPLSVVGAALVNFGLQLVILRGAYAVTDRWPAPGDLALVPLALVVLVVFAASLGMLLAAANVTLRDVQYLVDVGLLFWFWMTPIVYAWTTVKTALVTDRGMRWLFDVYMAGRRRRVRHSSTAAISHYAWACCSSSLSVCSGSPSGCSPSPRATSRRSCEQWV